jgi:hypothetical protein
MGRYRHYAIGASVASVVTASGAYPFDVNTLHRRPALIQEVGWRAPYGRAPGLEVEPVRDLRLSFLDDRLFHIVVNYDRERMEGLTDGVNKGTFRP